MRPSSIVRLHWQLILHVNADQHPAQGHASQCCLTDTQQVDDSGAAAVPVVARLGSKAVRVHAGQQVEPHGGQDAVGLGVLPPGQAQPLRQRQQQLPEHSSISVWRSAGPAQQSMRAALQQGSRKLSQFATGKLWRASRPAEAPGTCVRWSAELGAGLSKRLAACMAAWRLSRQQKTLDGNSARPGCCPEHAGARWAARRRSQGRSAVVRRATKPEHRRVDPGEHHPALIPC